MFEQTMSAADDQNACAKQSNLLKLTDRWQALARLSEQIKNEPISFVFHRHNCDDRDADSTSLAGAASLNRTFVLSKRKLVCSHSFAHYIGSLRVSVRAQSNRMLAQMWKWFDRSIVCMNNWTDSLFLATKRNAFFFYSWHQTLLDSSIAYDCVPNVVHSGGIHSFSIFIRPPIQHQHQTAKVCVVPVSFGISIASSLDIWSVFYVYFFHQSILTISTGWMSQMIEWPCTL